MSKLILITNPGSASRKYALYDGEELLAQLHFEYVGKKVVCTLKDAKGNKKDIKKEAEKKAIESMEGLKYRNLEITINDCYKTTTEEI